MANTTLTTSASTVVAEKLVKACSGAAATPGASIRMFTATAGTGNYPAAGLVLDLSALFRNKVLMCIVSPLHDPARTAGTRGYPAVYVPGPNNDPATGRVFVYRQNATTDGLIAPPDDNAVITGFVVTGFAVGF